MTKLPAKRGLALLFNPARLAFVLSASLLIGYLMSFNWHSGTWSVLERTLALGFIAMLTFGCFEQWPTRLPRWLARWVVQVLSVALSIPITTFFIYLLSTPTGAAPFWDVPDRLEGFGALVGIGILLAPWCALGALVRQKEALARHQALAFELERSELERQALDARLRLLQAQIAPHFLFNTLANVQALVDTGSPQAAPVLRSLIAYLRAAIPRINDAVSTLGEELKLARAYLELMQMRMPDRLQFALQIEAGTENLRCPPLSLLTLVENAVRHGIDPSEDGGRIDIEIKRIGANCLVRVSDTGVGLSATSSGSGTGLVNLRERLQLCFSTATALRVQAHNPQGVCAEVEFPAQGVSR